MNADDAETRRAAMLVRAKRIRERRLSNLAEIVAACSCTWPVENLRNGHGHRPGCPAIAVIEAHRRRRQAALDEAEW